MRLRTWAQKRPAPTTEDEHASARARSRARSTELWEAGDKEEALDELRRARLTHGPDSWLCFAYGTRAMQLGQGWAARAALHDAVELDPTNLDALEFFIEAESRHAAAPGAVTRALEALAERLPARASVDADALAFLLPALERSGSIEAGVRALGGSQDAVARLASRLALAEAEEWEALTAAGGTASPPAELLVRLGRGAYPEAAALMEASAPEALPVRSLRIAIRRELRRGREAHAIKLLKHYRRARPEDAWSQSKLVELTSEKPLSHYQLATKGFPFRQPKAEPAYEPVGNRSLYCVHNSLPHHSVGYATRTHGLLRGIREEGWDIHGVTRLGYPYDIPGNESLGDIEPQIDIDGVPYHRLSHAPTIERKNPLQPYVARYSKALFDLAHEHRPFVLHAASNYWNGLTAVQTARDLGIPSVYEVRGLWEVTRGSRDPEWMDGAMYRYMARMEADAASHATRVIAITAALRDELVRRGVDEDRITIVPNGVDTTRFVPRARNDELAARLGVTGKTVVGYVGSVLDYEGLDLLIDAAATLRRERENVVFLLVGDGAELPQLRERVEEERLGDTVLFTGRVPHHEVEDYYSIIDICPFPRLPMPVCEMVSPLKPFEAMAMGKAVVASDVAALAEIITHGKNGFLHRKGDAMSLTESLRVLVDRSDIRDEIAGNGMRWVRSERDWKTLAQRVTSVYDCLGEQR